MRRIIAGAVVAIGCLTPVVLGGATAAAAAGSPGCEQGTVCLWAEPEPQAGQAPTMVWRPVDGRTLFPSTLYDHLGALDNRTSIDVCTYSSEGNGGRTWRSPGLYWSDLSEDRPNYSEIAAC